MMLKYCGAIAVVAVIGWGGMTAQEQDCDAAAKTDAGRARRRTAIMLARQINSVQAERFAKVRRYQPLTELTSLDVPAGFDVQASTDGATYTFSVKDAQDGCKGAVFSYQNGVIYTATPLSAYRSLAPPSR